MLDHLTHLLHIFIADYAFTEIGTMLLFQLDLKGIASVFAGARAGTGLYLIDKLIDITTGNKPVLEEKKFDIVKQVFGNIMSTYLTPLQTALDFMAENDQELAIVRDSKSDPLWGQIKKKISPFVDVPILFISSINKQRIFKAIEKNCKGISRL